MLKGALFLWVLSRVWNVRVQRGGVGVRAFMSSTISSEALQEKPPTSQAYGSEQIQVYLRALMNYVVVLLLLVWFHSLGDLSDYGSCNWFELL